MHAEKLKERQQELQKQHQQYSAQLRALANERAVLDARIKATERSVQRLDAAIIVLREVDEAAQEAIAAAEKEAAQLELVPPDAEADKPQEPAEA